MASNGIAVFFFEPFPPQVRTTIPIRLDMEINEIKVMRGPNYWSADQHKLIAMKLDIGSYEHLSIGEVKCFCAQLFQLIPSLESAHFKNLDTEDNVDQASQLVPFIEQTALELQRLAGMDCRYGTSYA